MKFNKKIFLALLSAALLGAGDSLIESQSNSALTVVQAVKKSKAKSKIKKSIKSKKSKKTTKSKKSTKKKFMSTSKVYKALFGKKSNDPTLEKYRNGMVKVAKQFSDKLNNKVNVYLDLQATKNTHEYFIDYPYETYGKNPFIAKGSKIKKGHLASPDAIDLFSPVAKGLKNVPKATASKADIRKLINEGDYAYYPEDGFEYNLPNVGVKNFFGKYYYWVYYYQDGDEDSGEDFYHCCDLYPVSDFKFVIKKG